MKLTPRQLHPRAILSDEIIGALMREMPTAFGEQLYQMIKDRKVDVEADFRFRAVSTRCREVRESSRISLKDVSIALKVPQYRIKDIEGRGVSSLDPEILHCYLDFLGLRRWYRKWERANPKLASHIERPDHSE